ncbi:ATP-binding protein [Streptomyces sp. NPDC096310]|uniref:ATP-binding protein n=1 Tax=Streptomyces sp. NPDC096310 TaxID=3366082 RepID=UPI00381A0131
MKQSAVKTLGVAALGAAFAVAAAGSASAAPAVPDAGAALGVVGSVAKTLPLDEAATQLPQPLSGAATAAGSAVDTVEFTTPYALDAVRASNPLGDLVSDPLGTLLGGLPVNGLADGGLGVNGIPLGG